MDFEDEFVMGTQSNEVESQTQSQIELTQLFEETAESQSNAPTPISSPFVPVNQRTIPWGRLIRLADNDHNHHVIANPTNSHKNIFSNAMKVGIELLPRDPIRSSSVTTRSKSLSLFPSQDDHRQSEINFMGIKNLKPSDRFNEYILGRSAKCDIVASKQHQHMLNGNTNEGNNLNGNNTDADSKQKQNNWVHSMISNKHCRLFCLLKNQSPKTSQPRTPLSNYSDMEVYIEDTSGNGTMINQSTLLHRGERRLLHTGDEICLINPVTLQRKIRSVQVQKEILSHYSFVFINLLQTQRQHLRQQNPHNFRHIITSHNNATQDIESIVSTPKTPQNGILDTYAINSNTPLHQPIDGEQQKVPFHGKKENKDMPPPNCLSSSSKYSATFDQNQSRRIEEHYDLRDLLGSGTCGDVRRAINRKSGIQVAVKIIPIDARNQSQKALWGKYSQIHAEASILKSLNHPYIVQLLDVFCHPGKAIYLVMELLSGGDLFDRIVEKGRYSEVQSRRLMRRIFAAVFYLHEDCDIVHRDLKPENILCVSRVDDVLIKLSDFGLAKSVTEDGLKTFCGTPQYFAPEVLKRQNTIAGRGRYGKEADMWSLGIILYILLCGNPPFQISERMDIIAEAKISFRGAKWENISKEAIDLIKKLLIIDPKKRINISSACNHKWILIDDGDTHCIPFNDPILKKHRKNMIKTRNSENNEIERISGPHSSTSAKAGEVKPLINENTLPGSKLAKLSPPKTPKLELNIRRSNDVPVLSTPSQPQSTLKNLSPKKRPPNFNERMFQHKKVNEQKNNLNSPKKKDLGHNATTESITKISNLKTRASPLKIPPPPSPDESPRFPTPIREDQTPINLNTRSNKESLFSTVKQFSVDGFVSSHEHKKSENNKIDQIDLCSPLSSELVEGNEVTNRTAKKNHSQSPQKKNDQFSSSIKANINKISIELGNDVLFKHSSFKETSKRKHQSELSDDEIKSEFNDENVTNDSIRSFSEVSQDEKKSVENPQHISKVSSKLFEQVSNSKTEHPTNEATMKTSFQTKPNSKPMVNVRQNLSFDLNIKTKPSSKKDAIKENGCKSQHDEIDIKNKIDYNSEKVIEKSEKLTNKKRGLQDANSRDNIRKNHKTSAADTSIVSKGKQTTLSNWFKKK